MIKNEKMKLEDAITHLKKIAKEYNIYGDLDNPEFEDIKKIPEAINIVLQELNNLQEKNKNLVQYIGTQGMINDYLRYKNTKNRSCK